jgi:hypothetical protein
VIFRAIALSFFAVVFPQSFDGSWAGWHDVRTLEMPPVTSPTFVRVPLAGIDPGSAGTFPSVRIVDDTGAEVPYAIDPDRAEPAAGSPLPLSDAGYLAGVSTQAVVDFGPNPQAHTAIRIQSSRQTYLARASVEASDDDQTWRLMRDDAIVYHVAGSSDPGAQTISFDPTHARWIRIRLFDPRRIPIDAAYTDVRREARDALEPSGPPGEQSTGTNLGSRFQRWTFDFGSDYGEATAVRLLGGSVPFDRTLLIETSDDGRTWVARASDVEIRLDPKGPTATAAFDRGYARRWRVTLENGADADLSGVTCELLAQPHDLVFSAEPGRHYALLSSNGTATAPNYDLARVLARRDWHADTVATVAAVLPNTAYVDARPITERLPWLVNLGFTLAALVIGAFAFTTVRSATRTVPPVPGAEPPATSQR